MGFFSKKPLTHHEMIESMTRKTLEIQESLKKKNGELIAVGQQIKYYYDTAENIHTKNILSYNKSIYDANAKIIELEKEPVKNKHDISRLRDEIEINSQKANTNSIELAGCQKKLGALYKDEQAILSEINKLNMKLPKLPEEQKTDTQILEEEHSNIQ